MREQQSPSNTHIHHGDNKDIPENKTCWTKEASYTNEVASGDTKEGTQEQGSYRAVIERHILEIATLIQNLAMARGGESAPVFLQGFGFKYNSCKTHKCKSYSADLHPAHAGNHVGSGSNSAFLFSFSLQAVAASPVRM